jgi:DNA-binding transcriptional MerR regulator
MDSGSRYPIGKLAEAAGVTPRTVRYYIAEGLLPPPQTEGRYALYTDEHLRRLQLIQRLKIAFLPLATIKAQMAPLSDPQVQALLQACPAPPQDSPKPRVRLRMYTAEPHAQQSSMEYIAQILAVTGQTADSSAASEQTLRPKRVLLISPVLNPMAEETGTQITPKESMTEVAATSSAETWERIPLAAGVELHLRAPVAPEVRQRIEHLIATAKALLASED